MVLRLESIDAQKKERVYIDILTGQEVRKSYEAALIKSECPLCNQRREVLDRLNRIGEKSGGYTRELKRTAQMVGDAGMLRQVEVGEVETVAQNSCTKCAPESQIIDTFLPQWDAGGQRIGWHHKHQCLKCKMHWPRNEGSYYEKGYVDPDLE